MSGDLDPHYDYALLGTSLPLAILSAALAKAGHSVLHVDEEEHYGGPWASVALTELVRLVGKSSVKQDTKDTRDKSSIIDAMISFPAYSRASGADGNDEQQDDSDAVPQQLRALNRHFAISLSPTLLPCSGPTIDVLVRSKVASYCTFRLLQQTAIYACAPSSSTSTWPLQSVPSSKEDIFKNKKLTLVSKRKLMKLLQYASSQGSAEREAGLHGKIFLDYLVDKDGAGLPVDLAKEVAYGVALCSSPTDSSRLAMLRIRKHISSIGRYGNSAYLVGQYGGAGEMAQCYSRASAVQGSVFVLGHQISSLEKCDGGETSAPGTETVSKDERGDERWRLALQDIQGETRVGCIVGDADILDRPHLQGLAPAPLLTGRQAVGIMLLDRGIKIDDQNVDASPENTEDDRSRPPETALVVFPPSGQDGKTVWAIQMGEGTFSCPKGTYLIYLIMAVVDADDDREGGVRLQTSDEAKQALAKAREGVLRLASHSEPEFSVEGKNENPKAHQDGEGVVPLMESYFVRKTVPQAHSLAARHAADDQLKQLAESSVVRVDSPLGDVATSLDDATLQAEDLFWLLTSGRSQGGGTRASAQGSEAQRQDARAQAEAMRRRLWRRGYTVGRGLGGTMDDFTGDADGQDDANRPSAALDFFPVDEDVTNGPGED